jgi:hypothetical protein
MSPVVANVSSSGVHVVAGPSSVKASGSSSVKASGAAAASDAELTKKQRRLNRNRLSAQLHRERKKQYLEKLERDCKRNKEENEKLKVQVKGLMTENAKLREQVESAKRALMATEEMLANAKSGRSGAPDSLAILEDFADSERGGSPIFDDSSAADTLDSYASHPLYPSPHNSDDEMCLLDEDEANEILDLDLGEGIEGLDELEHNDEFDALTSTAPEGTFTDLRRWASGGLDSFTSSFSVSKKKRGRSDASSARKKRAKTAAALAGFVFCFAFFGGGVDLGIGGASSSGIIPEAATIASDAITLNFDETQVPSVLAPGMRVIGNGHGLMVGDAVDVDHEWEGRESAESRRARRNLMSVDSPGVNSEAEASTAKALRLLSNDIPQKTTEFASAVWNELRGLMNVAPAGGKVFSADPDTAQNIFNRLSEKEKKQAILTALRAFVLHQSGSVVDIASSESLASNSSLLVCPQAHGFFSMSAEKASSGSSSPRSGRLRSGRNAPSRVNETAHIGDNIRMWVPTDSVQKFGSADVLKSDGFFELGCKLESFHPHGPAKGLS